MKRLSTDLTCPSTVPLPTTLICPFLSVCIASLPLIVRPAVLKPKNPSQALTRLLMNRSSFSMRLLRYLHCRSLEPRPFIQRFAVGLAWPNLGDDMARIPVLARGDLQMDIIVFTVPSLPVALELKTHEKPSRGRSCPRPSRCEIFHAEIDWADGVKTENDEVALSEKGREECNAREECLRVIKARPASRWIRG